MQDFKEGLKAARDQLLSRVYNVDPEISRELIEKVEMNAVGTPEFKSGITEFCNRLYSQLKLAGPRVMGRSQLVGDYGIAGSHRKLVQAYDFAKEKHEGQLRKDGIPYFTHPERVAKRVTSFLALKGEAVMFERHSVDMVTSAILHDVVEDCGVTVDEIRDLFGLRVSIWVDGLTNCSGINHEDRAYKTRKKLLSAPWEVKLIKCMDIIDNGETMAIVDPGYGKIWYANKQKLFDEGFLNEVPALVKDFTQLTITTGYNLSLALSKK